VNGVRGPFTCYDHEESSVCFSQVKPAGENISLEAWRLVTKEIHNFFTLG